MLRVLQPMYKPLARYQVVAGCEKLLQKVENRRSCEFVGRSAAQREQGGRQGERRAHPLPHRTPSPYFSAYISLIHPHDLKSWNGLRVIVIFATKSVYVAYFTVLRQTLVLQQVTPMPWLPRVLIVQKSVSSRKLYQHFFYLLQNKLLVSVARLTLA